MKKKNLFALFGVFVVLLQMAVVNGTFAQTYCTPTSATYGSTGFSSSDYYTAITTSGPATTTNISYTASGITQLYTDSSATDGVTAALGSAISLTLTSISSSYNSAAVYIDWNQNGVFTDPGEQVVGGTSSDPSVSSSGTTFTITVPAGATPGTTRMRIVDGSYENTGTYSTNMTSCSCYKNCQYIDFYFTVAPDIDVTVASASPAAGDVATGTSNVLLETFPITVSGADATLTGLTITTAGDYTATDITDLKCWYSASPVFSTGSAILLSTITSSLAPGTQVFPSFSQDVPAGTAYLFVTTDVAAAASVGDSISISATPLPDFAFGAATVTGGTTASSSQIFVSDAPCTGVTTNTITPASLPVACGSNTVSLGLMGGYTGGVSGITYQWGSSTSDTGSTLAPIPGATLSTYTATDSVTTYYICTTTCTVTGTSASSASIITVSVNPTPVLTVTPAGGSFCSGTSGLAMTASGASTYTWAPATGLTATTGDTVTANSAYMTTYTVTGTSAAGCTSADTLTVAYYTTPLTPTVTPTSVLECVGGPVNLFTAAVGTAGPFSDSTNVVSGSAATGYGTASSTNAVTIPTGASVTGITVTLNITSNYLNDYIVNLQGANGSILNLVNQEGPHGSGSYTGTMISSAGGAALSTGASPFTGTFSADAASGAGPAGDMSNITSWSGLYDSIVNGTWTLYVYNSGHFTNTLTLNSWTITVYYNLPSVTWSPVTNLFIDSAGTTTYSTGTAADTVYENPLMPATAAYTVTAANGGCTATAVVTATVAPVAAATVTPSLLNLCDGAAETLTAAVTGGAGDATYTWSGPGITGVVTTTAGSYTATPPSGTSASYSVAVSYTVPGCPAANAATDTINVISYPVVTGLMAAETHVCSGDTVTLSAAVTGTTAPLVYTWSGPGIASTTGSASSILVIPVSSLTATGDYSVTAVTAVAGCADSTAGTIMDTVNAVPVPFTATGGSYCAGGTGVVISLDSSVAGVYYQLTYDSVFVGGPVAGTGSAISFGAQTVAGTYIIGAEDLTTGCIDSMEGVASVSINPAIVPTVSITAAPGLALSAGGTCTFTATVMNGGSAPAYQWYVNGMPVSGATSATFTADSLTGDSVSCSVINTDMCGTADTTTVSITHDLAVHQSAVSGMRMQLVPNPNNGSFTIAGLLSSTQTAAAMLEITDMTGQTVYKHETTAQNGVINQAVQLGNTLPDGMYLLHIHSGDDNLVFHFVLKQ